MTPPRAGAGDGVDPALSVAIRASAARVAVLLRGVRHPAAPALGAWDLTDLAIHLCHAVEGITALARGGGPLLEDLSELSGLTTMLVEGEGERDLAALADRLEAAAEVLVTALVEAGGGQQRAWLVRGVDVPTSTVAGHVLNELVVHGFDLARAQGAAWPVPDRHAALVLDAFLMPIIGHLGRAVVDQRAAAGTRATYDLRVRGGGRYLLHFAAGDLTIEPMAAGSGPEPRPVDCHLSVAPAAFLLVAWGRRSQWPAIARGQFLAWGRRPWLGPRLRSLLANP